VEFARAYFWLDTSMANRLCKELGPSETANVVEEYLQRVDQEARSLGYAFDYMKQELYQVETRTSLKEADKAQVRLTATRKRAINPVFGAMAEVFALTQAQPGGGDHRPRPGRRSLEGLRPSVRLNRKLIYFPQRSFSNVPVSCPRNRHFCYERS